MMKNFLSDLIPRIQRYSRKLDELSLLQNQQWVSVNQQSEKAKTFIFRSSGELLVVNSGIVQRGTWEYLSTGCLLVSFSSTTLMLNHAFFDKNVLILNINSFENYSVFVNQSKEAATINSVDAVERYLSRTYLNPELEHVRNLNTCMLQTEDGKIMHVKTRLDGGFAPGDYVFVDGLLANDGTYILSTSTRLRFWSKFITIQNGRIIT